MFRKLDAYKLYLGLQFCTGLFFSMMFVVASLYEATVAGLTGTQLVLVGTTVELTILFFEIPTGIVADAYSRRLSIIIGFFLMGFGFLIRCRGCGDCSPPAGRPSVDRYTFRHAKQGGTVRCGLFTRFVTFASRRVPMSHQDPVSPPAPSPSRAASLWGASIADPGPLGLAGFAGTTFFLSVVNTNMLGTTVQGSVLGLALFYGGLAQLLAGMWEFTKGNTFGALAFSSFGAFWLSFWYLINHVVPAELAAKAAPLDILHSVGLYLLVWSIFTAYMTVAALRTTGAVLVVFVLLTLTFIALTIGFFAESVSDFEANSNGWIHLGGWLGIVTALAAWYASFAVVVNATHKRVVFPVFPRSS